MTSRRTRRGAQAVEFALVLPVVMLIASGVIDYGQYFNRDMEVLTAARDAARSASAMENALGDPSPCALADEVVDEHLTPSGLATGAQVTVQVVDVTDGAASDRVVRVDVSVPYTSPFGLFSVSPSAHTSSATMRLRDQTYATCGPTTVNL